MSDEGPRERAASLLERLVFWLPGLAGVAVFVLTLTSFGGRYLDAEELGLLQNALRALLILALALTTGGMAGAVGFALIFLLRGRGR